MQLDFIGNIYNNSFIQGDLFDTPVARKPFTKDVEEFFHSVTSNEIQEHYNYWSKITPEEPEQKFQRYLCMRFFLLFKSVVFVVNRLS